MMAGQSKGVPARGRVVHNITARLDDVCKRHGKSAWNPKDVLISLLGVDERLYIGVGKVNQRASTNSTKENPKVQSCREKEEGWTRKFRRKRVQTRTRGQNNVACVHQVVTWTLRPPRASRLDKFLNGVIYAIRLGRTWGSSTVWVGAAWVRQVVWGEAAQFGQNLLDKLLVQLGNFHTIVNL